MINYIHIDYRKPHTKEEKGFYGLTNVDTHTADVFINVNKHRNGKDLIDTFFHEMVHVFLEFHGAAGQMSNAKEEKLARKIGQMCAEVLK